MKGITVAGALLALGSPVMAQTAAPVANAPAISQAATLARQIATATFQPEKMVADSVESYSRQFDAGVTRGAAGRALSKD